jgi:hypothetical protein
MGEKHPCYQITPYQSTPDGVGRNALEWLKWMGLATNGLIGMPQNINHSLAEDVKMSSPNPLLK